MTTVIVLLRKKDGMSPEDFRRHWRDVHGPIARRMPSVRRYIQNHAIADNSPYDGIAELWFDTPEDMQTAFTSEAAAEAARDAPNFLAEQQVILVEEEEQ